MATTPPPLNFPNQLKPFSNNKQLQLSLINFDNQNIPFSYCSLTSSKDLTKINNANLKRYISVVL